MTPPARNHTARTLIAKDPFLQPSPDIPWDALGRWPCAWIHLPAAGEPPLVVAYRLRFSLPREAAIRAHASADERYELYLDGQLIGRGSESSDPANWAFETYDLALAAGEHVLVARVSSLGPCAPLAQMSAHPGFLFAAEGEWASLLGTGLAAWEGKPLAGYTFSPPVFPWGTGAGMTIDGREFPWGFERGAGDGWQPATVLEPGASCVTSYGIPPLHRLRPAALPPMLQKARSAGTVRLVASVPSADTAAIPVRAADHRADEAPEWSNLAQGRGEVVVPPHTARRVILDLEDYCCAYLELVTSGGAGSTIRVLWAEGLFEEPHFYAPKGNRDRIEGKHYVGIGDTFRPAGGHGRRFQSLWWHAGRYLELFVQTGAEPLTIAALHLTETRYPLEMESTFTSSDPALARVTPILVRGLQMCAHETYMDCPYYERLMYIGDARLEALTTYVMARDDRLPRQALRLLDASRLPDGLTQSRYPSCQVQIIPPFSLWWVAMVHDYAFWRDDRPTVEALLPGVRAVVERYSHFIQEDGLVHSPAGWNVYDWVPAWTAGVPPEGVAGVSGLMNWQFVYVLTLVADLAGALGHSDWAAGARRQAADLAARATEAFWDGERGLLADDRARQHFSEHTQCLAILSGLLGPERREKLAQGLLQDGDLARTTIYFSHYLFEAYRELGRIGALFDRLGLWLDLEGQGLKTTLESPEPSRSDCHAWGAHPLFHFFASILGIRPSEAGFGGVVITPQLGPLERAGGRLVHPRGEIVVEVERRDGELRGTVELPQGVTGVARIGGRTQPLHEGWQAL